jgi:hypothetical protein
MRLRLPAARLRPFTARALALAAAVLLLAAAPGRAQSGAVELVVTDAETGAPLAGAVVRLDGGSAGVSDAGGHVHLDGLAPGVHSLEVEMMGHTTLQPQVEIAAGQVLELEVVLDPAAIRIPAITAEASPVDGPGNALSRAFSRTRGAGGILITREEIRRSRASRLSELLGKVPGVRMMFGSGGAVATFNGSGGPESIALGNPGKRCVAQVFMDGVILRNPSVDIISLQDLESVEVYPHVVPAEFSGSNAGCGVIVLHTRTQ